MVVTGQAVFMIGGYLDNYVWMVAGRVIFGLCADCVIVGQNVLISKWFRNGTELAFAIMMGYFCSKFFSSLNAFVTPMLYDYSGNLGFPMFVGACITVMSMLGGVCAILIDMRESAIVAKNNEQFEDAKASIYVEVIDEDGTGKKVHDSSQEEPNSESNVKESEPNETIEANRATAKDENNTKIDIQIKASIHKKEKFSCKDILKIKPLVWWLYLNSACNNAGFWGFLNVANLFLQDRFGISASTAGILLTILYFSSGAFNAVFGKIIDGYGHRITLSMLACILLTGCLVALTILPDMDNQIYIPIAPLALMGLSNAMFTSAFYPSLPLLVPPNLTGTAFGLLYCTLNMGLTFLPEVIGYLYDVTQDDKHGFFWATGLLSAISGCGILVLTLVMVKYKKETRFLNSKYKGSVVIKRSTILQ